MSRLYPDDSFLNGNYAPWPLESEIHDLVVEGELPRALAGTLFRNDPNPQYALRDSAVARPARGARSDRRKSPRSPWRA